MIYVDGHGEFANLVEAADEIGDDFRYQPAAELVPRSPEVEEVSQWLYDQLLEQVTACGATEYTHGEILNDLINDAEPEVAALLAKLKLPDIWGPASDDEDAWLDHTVWEFEDDGDDDEGEDE